MAKMQAPAGAISCSAGGQTYKVRKGAVCVPDEFCADLLAHGFTVIGDAELDKQPSAEELAAAQAQVDGLQAALDAETDDAKKAEMQIQVDEAKAALAELQG